MARPCAVSPIAKKHYRISLADALSAHERALALGPGRAGVPNPGLVESGIARPYCGYYRKIEQKAAALTQSMACNHGFADGNKRTTLILVYLLIQKSGYALHPRDGEDLDQSIETMILNVSGNHLPFADIETWFKDRILKI